MSSRIALFAGSFDPFTVGHDSVVRRGLAIFDSIVIAVGVSDSKQGSVAADQRVATIKKLYSAEPRVEVCSYSGLTIDVALSKGACCLLRGVRNSKDFEYELSLADINRQLSGIETLFLPTEPSLSSISSSVVRELQKYGRDTSCFLPSESHE